MPHFYLPGQPVRFETGEAAATLLRKGWAELPERPDPAAQWDGKMWLVPEIVPEPQWVAFGAALAADIAVNALVAAARDNAPVLHLMLGVGLGQAAQGDAKTFSAAWTAARSLGLVSAQLVGTMQATAASFDLPAEFIDSLGA